MPWYMWIVAILPIVLGIGFALLPCENKSGNGISGVNTNGDQ
jgi:hypothetical protein